MPALQVALALTLSTGEFLIARSAIHVAVLIGILRVAGVFWLRGARRRPTQEFQKSRRKPSTP